MSRWRWAVAAGVMLAVAPGCTQRCNPGRLFLTVTLPGDVAARTARLSVRLSVGDQVRVAPLVEWRGHAGSNSFDVDFASGYQAGIVLTASAVALDDGGAPVGYSQHGELTLASGCDALTLAVPAAPALHLVAGALGGPGSADGVGANARLDHPIGLTVGGDRLYVADHDSSTVRMIDLASATVSTLAGVTGAKGTVDGVGAAVRLTQPNDLALVGTTLYLADAGGYVIRAIDLTTGRVSTIAGGHQGYRDTLGSDALFGDPYGLCADGGNLYVTDNGNHVVRKIALTDTKVSSLIDVASADLGTPLLIQDPNGIACGGSGVFYVADGQNNAIRKVTTNADGRATLDTVLVTAPSLNSPHAVVRDGDNLYIADTNSSTIRQLPVAGGAALVIAGVAGATGSTDGAATTVARFNQPEGLAVDANHDLYIADSGNDAIRKLTLATGMVSTLAGAAAHRDNTNGSGPVARFIQPLALASDGAGAIYLAGYGDGQVRKLVFTPGTLDVTVSCFAGAPPQCPQPLIVRSPAAVAIANDGTLYVAGNGLAADASDFNGAFAVLPPGGMGRAIASGVAGGLSTLPGGLAIDADGNVYLADTGNHVIRRLDHASGALTLWAGQVGSPGSVDGVGTAARLTAPDGLVSDGHRLYVAGADRTIRVVDIASATVTTLAGDPSRGGGSEDGVGADARFLDPSGLALDGRGNLYVGDADNHLVRRIALASGTVSTWLGTASAGVVLPGPLPAALNEPASLAVLPDGTMVIADFAENAVLVVR